MLLWLIYKFDFAENWYKCTFYHDVCLKELIFSKLLLVVSNLCNMQFFCKYFVRTVLTDLLDQAWDFSGIPEFSRPQRSFSWKSQIRFNIYGGGGGWGATIYSVCSLSVSNAGTARHKSSQASCVYTMSTVTSIYCNGLISLSARILHRAPPLPGSKWTKIF